MGGVGVGRRERLTCPRYRPLSVRVAFPSGAPGGESTAERERPAVEMRVLGAVAVAVAVAAAMAVAAAAVVVAVVSSLVSLATGSSASAGR